MIPAGAVRYPIEAPFFPDWWLVNLPNAISATVKVYEETGGVWRLTGTGSVGFPPNQEPPTRTIYADSSSVLPVLLSVYASVGYPPPAYVPPITVAKAQTSDPVSSAYSVGALTPSRAFSLNFGGDLAIICVSAGDAAAGTASIASVVIGGVSAVKLKENSLGGAGADCLSLWAALGVPSGNIVCTVTANTTLQAEVVVFGFVAGIVSGNFDGVAWNDASPRNVSVVGRDDLSALFGFYQDSNTSGNEVAGALLYRDDVSNGRSFLAIYRRNGAANHTFSFQDAGAGRQIAEVVEVYPT